MLSWEQTLARALHRVRLDSIKRKILAFSIVATLIPSLSIGWIFYADAHRFLTKKVAQDLKDATAQNVRELDLWLKERLYEVRVFSNSDEVSDDLVKISRAGVEPGMKALALHRLNDYLKSVRNKFSDYEELAVLNATANPIASSAQQVGVVNLPPDWQRQAKADSPIIGEAYMDNTLGKMVMLLVVPIKGQDDRFLGMLAAKLNFHTVEDILRRSPLGATGQSYLISPNGTVIAASRENVSDLVSVTHPFTVTAVGSSELEPVMREYPDFKKKLVIGAFKRMSQTDWGVVAQIRKQEIYAQITQIRILTVAVSSGLLLVIGLAAYLLGLTIVRPLSRLTAGASNVAAGDLGVVLPVVGGSEVGYLTEVFNNMVDRLRHSQDKLATANKELTDKNKELETLSITDNLTGLRNRKYFMEVLAAEVTRARRNTQPFSVMMIDTDHFKKYNDTFGHQAGDALLAKIGTIFLQTLRNEDCASRYGGDEFIVLLPEITMEKACEVAKRLRELLLTESLNGDTVRTPVTLSIGVAAFPDHGETPESLITSADNALYHAKRTGRNRVVLADPNLHPAQT